MKNKPTKKIEAIEKFIKEVGSSPMPLPKQAKETLEQIANDPSSPMARAWKEHVCPPHEHSYETCAECSKLFANGQNFAVEQITYNQSKQNKESPTWHIHMTWLILCIVSGALGFYFGYPSWTR